MDALKLTFARDLISVVYETKWCMRILLATDLKINRFNQIHIYLGISRSVLARNLNLLIRSELIKKQTIANSQYDYYELTRFGQIIVKNFKNLSCEY